MAVKKSAVRTIYNIVDGPVSMYEIDARHALKFSKEWSETPWKKNGEQSVPIIEIPDDWQDGRPTERIGLAVRLGAERKGLTAADADKVISAELEKRAEVETEGGE